MVSEKLRCLQGRGKLEESNEIHYFGEMISNGQKGGITCLQREAGDVLY